MNTEKIGYIEAISIITLVVINKVILILPKEIISNTGSAAWINTIYVSILAVLLAWFISFLFKKFEGKDILDVGEFLGGSTLKIIIGILYIIMLIIVPIFVLKNFTEILKTIYFRTSPFLYIALFFIVSTTIANHFSSKVLAKANLLLMLLSFFSIIIILVASFKNFSFDNIYPILGYGLNETFVKGLGSLFSFSSIGYLFLFGPILDKPKNLKKIAILSITASGICLTSVVLCILLSFSFSFKSDELISLYLLTRTIEFGRFIQRIDAVFIFMWIVSAILYVCFAIHFAIYLFKKITKISDSSCMNYNINLFILSIILIPVGIATFNSIARNMFKYLTFGILFIGSPLVLILANLKLKFNNKKKSYRKE